MTDIINNNKKNNKHRHVNALRRAFTLIINLILAGVLALPVYAGEAVVLFRPVFSDSSNAVTVSAAELAEFNLNGASAAGNSLSPSIRMALSVCADVGVSSTSNFITFYPALSQSNNQAFALVKSDTMSDEELAAALKRHDGVMSVSPNYRIKLFSGAMTGAAAQAQKAEQLEQADALIKLPNDPSLDLCWGIKKIKAPEAWTVTTGSRDVYVALIDSGTYVHPDLEKNLSTDLAMSFSLDSESSTDWNIDYAPHGTHVAGTIGAVGNNNIGVAGVNWEVSILPIRLYFEKESTFLSVLLKCMDYLISVLNSHKDLKFAAVNMSLGSYSSQTPDEMKNNLDPLWVAFKTLDDLNRVVIVVGAGNDGLQVGAPAPFDQWEFFWRIEGRDEPDFYEGDYCYPSSFTGLNNMIVVGSMASNDTAAASSCWGESVDIAAPGVDIFSTYAEPLLYKISSGTSMATPHVTGAAALLASKYPNATANQIKRALLAGADTNNNPLITPYYQYLYEDLPFPVLWEMHEKMNLDGTERVSRTGMLDVKAALAALDGIMAEQEKKTSTKEAASSGCVVGGAAALAMMTVIINGVILLMARRRRIKIK